MTERAPRRLAAVVSVDVVGYSRLMGLDEDGTIAALRAHRAALVDPTIGEHGGRIVKTMGDGLLLEYGSVVDATRCVIAIQEGMAERNRRIDPAERIVFRIGVNVGDIIVDGEDILGDGVNVAARLQEIAEPGGVALSHRAYEDVRDRLDAPFADGGEITLKNIARPVRVWRWPPPDASSAERVAISAAIDAAQSPRPADKPSIVVLPFRNISGDPEQEYFADGLTEDLITSISYWRSFPVIARNSSFAFKGQTVQPGQLAEELGVRYVLEGSIRKAGARIRVTAVLADAESGLELWAERFDRSFDDIFDLQDEITRKVAAATGYQLQQAEIARSAARSSEDATAWDLVAKGLPHFYEHTCETNGRARALFEQAVAAAPNYSDAWAHLAWAYGHDLMLGCVDDKTSVAEKGLEAGRRAIALDQNSALARLAMSSVHIWSGDIDAGLAEAKASLQLNPNDVRAAFAVGNRITLAGDIAEGLAIIEDALALNPRDPYRWHYFGYLSRGYLSLGEAERAADWARQAVQLRPDQAETHFRLALCYAHLGQIEAAREAIAHCDRLEPGFVARRKDWRPYPSEDRNAQLLGPLRENGLLWPDDG